MWVPGGGAVVPGVVGTGTCGRVLVPHRGTGPGAHVPLYRTVAPSLAQFFVKIRHFGHIFVKIRHFQDVIPMSPDGVSKTGIFHKPGPKTGYFC